MGEERQPHFRAEPVGSASRDARKAIISAWAAGARPLRHGNPADYERMRQLMSAYLDTTFPEVPAAGRLDAVNRALASIVAYENVQPEELIEALDDAGLHPSGRTPDERHRDDERVARLAFGATTTGVRAALAGLARDGQALEFQIITLYLDLVDRDPSEPPASAEVVAGIGPMPVTEQEVRAALIEFRDHIQRAVADERSS
jgi:hypothetical protein